MYYMFYTSGKVAMNASWKSPQVKDEAYVCYTKPSSSLLGDSDYWLHFVNGQLSGIDESAVPGVYKAKFLLLRK